MPERRGNRKTKKSNTHLLENQTNVFAGDEPIVVLIENGEPVVFIIKMGRR